MSRWVSVFLLSSSLCALACEGDTYGFREGLTVDEFEQLRRFLTCIECDDGERDAIVAFTDTTSAIGLLRESLRGLPPGREENIRRRMEAQLQVMEQAGIDTAGLMDSEVRTFRSLVQSRSAVALADLDAWDTLRVALDSSEVWGYRTDVLEEIQSLLFADTAAVPIPGFSDGVVHLEAREVGTAGPVVGMAVQLRRCSDAPGVRIGGTIGACVAYEGQTESGSTDASGERDFTGLDEGVYEVTSDPSTGGPGDYTNVTPDSVLVLVVGPADVDTVRLTVGNLNVVRGAVRGTDGSPADGAEVLVTPHPANVLPSFADTLLPVSTGGEFILENLPEGRFYFEAQNGPASDWRCTNPPTMIDVRGLTSEHRVDLECGWVTEVMGTVTAPDGSGVVGVTVTLQGAVMMGAITDANGNFRFLNVPGDEYEISLSGLPSSGLTASAAGGLSSISPRFFAAPEGLNAGPLGWDFDRSEVTGTGPASFVYFGPSGVFRGRVIEEGNLSQPQQGVRMLLQRCDDSFGTASSSVPIRAGCHSYDARFSDYPATSLTDVEGLFAFNGLHPGVYEVRIDRSVPGVQDFTGPILFRISTQGTAIEFMSDTDVALNFQGG